MAWPDYITGTGRRLPLDFNLRVLGEHDNWLQDWADMVATKDLGVLSKGEILLIPKGILHEETTSGRGIVINPISDNYNYWAGIVCEDPNDKARLQLTNDTPDGPELYAFDLHKHSSIYDIAAGLTSSHHMTGVAPAVIHTRPVEPGRIVGCTNNNILLPNCIAFDPATGAGVVVIFILDGDGSIGLCAYDQSKPIDIGGGGLTGAVVGNHNDGTIANSTFNDLAVGVVHNGPVGNTVYLANVLSQGSTAGAGDFYAPSGGTFDITTCKTSTDPTVTMAADGFTPTADPGDGTDLSGAATDDINGLAWNPFKIGAARWYIQLPRPIQNVSSKVVETVLNAIPKTVEHSAQQSEISRAAVVKTTENRATVKTERFSTVATEEIKEAETTQ